MTSNRLEAFSDGVLAIVITIMVLEMKVPHGTEAAALRPLLPVFATYVLSFIYLGIYWSNHHHLFQAVQHVTGAALLAILHLLFWLSLIPFVTGWMGENHLAPLPVALYGIVLLGAAVAYRVLTWTLLAHHGRESVLARALGRDRKGKASVVAYLLAISLAAVSVWPPVALYVAVALWWLIPDPRVERTLACADSVAGGRIVPAGSGPLRGATPPPTSPERTCLSRGLCWDRPLFFSIAISEETPLELNDPRLSAPHA